MTPKKGAETSEERPIDATELTPSTEVAASDPAHPVAIDAGLRADAHDRSREP